MSGTAVEPAADARPKKNVVLVFSAETYRAEAFIEAASSLGIDLIVASDFSGGSAELLGDRYVRISLDDPEGAAKTILDALGERRPSAILALDDAGVSVAGAAALSAGIGRNHYQGLVATTNKVALRKRLEEAGVSQPRFWVIDRLSEGSLRAAAEHCGFPCVVKPAELRASTGVIRTDRLDSLVEAAREAYAIQQEYLGRVAPLVVEEFLPGREIAVEGVLVDGDLEVLSFIDKPETPEGPYFPETILVTPARLSDDDRRAVAELVGQATRALGLVDGPVHAELREGDKGFRLLEVAARTIGGLCSKALLFESDASDAFGMASLDSADRASGKVPSDSLASGEGPQRAVGSGGGSPRVARSGEVPSRVVASGGGPSGPAGSGALGSSTPMHRTLEEVVLRRALGDLGEVKCTDGFSGVVMLYPDRPGRLRAIDGVDEAAAVKGIRGIDLTVRPGTWVDPLPRGNRYLGFVFARADSAEECIAALQAARDLIRFEIEEQSDAAETGTEGRRRNERGPEET